MEDWTVIIVAAGLLLLWFVPWLFDTRGKAKKYEALKPRLDDLDSLEAKLQSKESALNTRQEQWEKWVQYQTDMVNGLAAQKSEGFPWLAEAYADFFHLQDLRRADYLEHKKHPARRAAEHVREIATKRRIAEKLYRVLKYQLEYYENLFPWLVEFKSEDVDHLIRQLSDRETKPDGDVEEPDDRARKWLTQEEYRRLSTVQRNQLALDRYRDRKKSKWEIGRAYERYVGYLYETRGYRVYYQGIVEGLQDLGRDLVAKKGDETEIVQCKCWSRRKTIHEKHVFQLFGTTIEYWLKNRQDTESLQPSLFPELTQRGLIKATFVTLTSLSDKAREFARVLGVEVWENFPLEEYPCVKCNVSRRTGEKIYHLPFDQQYDRTLVEEDRDEYYVETVREAEELGFRRAFRWRGQQAEEPRTEGA